MKIYDCFMFFDEEMLLDLRLNIMDEYVDKFVITEATYMHSGKSKKLIFDINKFSKFKDKIIYIVVNKPPDDLFEIAFKTLFVPSTATLLIVISCSGFDAFFAYATSVILAK